MSITHENEPRANRIRAEYDALIGRGQSTPTPTQAVVSKAKGVYLWTEEGRKLIDFTSGVLVTNLGHGHPRFEQRFKKYRKGLPRNAYNMVTELQVEATRRLVAAMNQPKLCKALWAASGSEGIQKAMWACQHRYPDRNILLATRFGFHGKKGLAADVTGETSKNPNVRFLSFPMHEARPHAYFEQELENLWREHAQRIALLITEPYLGAAGSFHPPKWYHQLLQHWCNSHDIPLIFDEVQSCFGRTGSMFAFQSYGIEPDMVVLGKGLANGEPAAVAIGRQDLVDALDFGEASDTFSASPMACAAVCATLDVFEEENILKHVQKVAEHCRAGFAELQQAFPFIRGIRGEGLVFGLELDTPERANACVLEAYRGNGKKGVHFLGPLAKKVLRVSPPLVITRKELDEAFKLLHQAWKRVQDDSPAE